MTAPLWGKFRSRKLCTTERLCGANSQVENCARQRLCGSNLEVENCARQRLCGSNLEVENCARQRLCGANLEVENCAQQRLCGSNLEVENCARQRLCGSNLEADKRRIPLYRDHRVGRVLSFFLQSSELGLPHTPPAGECAPPLWFGGGGSHWGSPSSDEGTYTVVLCIYKYFAIVTILS